MHAAVPSAQRPRGRILVIDDDRAVAATLASLLESEGYAVRLVRDGGEALSCLRGGPSPDLIILDLMMPVVDGWQFRTLQRADPRLSAIPVLAMSADGTSKAAAIDASAFLHKPFRLDDLLGQVAHILAERERARIGAQQTARLTALGTLVAGAVHEISNPLSCVIANLATIERQLDLQREESSTPAPSLDSLQETARWARVGTDRICGVVRGLQSVARKSNDRHRAVDIRSVLDSAVVLTAHQLRHCARVIKVVPEALPLIRGSELGLGQLFTNLLINAAHAIGEGNAQANEVRLRVLCDERGMVIEVSDTGAGISPETRAHIFEPFFTTKPAGKGTGLGLSICRTIIDEHNGAIEVESEPGRGSLFRIILPVEPDAAVVAPPSRDETLEPQPERRGRVLVVDDEPEVGWGLKHLLEPEHEVTPVTHGQEVLDRLLWGQHFDVILCNLSMPFMTGQQLYQALARRFGDRVLRRIVFVSGGALSGHGREFLDQVPNRRLAKPFDPDELVALVREMVAAASEQPLDDDRPWLGPALHDHRPDRHLRRS